jgi:hypothetical protein
MQVYHCGRNIFVPQEFLNCPDIIAILEKMCGKAVSETNNQRLVFKVNILYTKPDAFSYTKSACVNQLCMKEISFREMFEFFSECPILR